MAEENKNLSNIKFVFLDGDRTFLVWPREDGFWYKEEIENLLVAALFKCDRCAHPLLVRELENTKIDVILYLECVECDVGENGIKSLVTAVFRKKQDMIITGSDEVWNDVFMFDKNVGHEPDEDDE